MTDAMAGLERRRRGLDRLLMFVPYLALLGSTALVLTVDPTDVPHKPYPWIFALVVLSALWVAWWATTHPQWEHDKNKMAVFFVGLVALIYALVWCSSLFGFFAWTGYVYIVYALHGRWRIVGGTAVAVATAVSQAGGFDEVVKPSSWGFFALVLTFNVVIANAMIFLTTMTHEQSAKRAQMIDELAEANAKLASALQENAGLHAQLLVQAREAGVLDERQRMAGEIHDVLAQGLTGIVTQLEAADAAADRPDDLHRHLGAARQLARDGLTEARRSVQALRPQTLDTAALPEAIEEVVDGWAELTGVTARLITTGTARPLLPEIELTLLRTAQEALANVARHAAADRVGLTLSYMEDVVTLDVRDDGAGFDPSAAPDPAYEGGYGLAAMRERLLRIAGTLDVESEPGGGTALSACVPAIGVAA